MKPFLEAIDERVLVCDGAMGTMLYAKGVFINRCFDALNLADPARVAEVHRDYVRAGADVLETNTFGANRIKLRGFGLADSLHDINAAGARLARTAAGAQAYVAGAIGPLGIRIEPWGPTSRAEATAHFRRQVVGLLEGGVDGFVLETFSDLAEIECAYAAVRAETDLPVVAQMTVGSDARTAYGTDARHIAEALTGLGADAIGLNCSVGPAVMLDAIEEMAETTTRPLSAQPNAGLPRTVRDRQIYMASPEYVAEYARRMIQLGVRFVGGCCGTTPAHVRALADVVRQLSGRTAAPRTFVRATPSPQEGAVEPVPLAERSAWGAKLARREQVLSVEIVPPHSWDGEEVLAAARELSAGGVDAVAVVDTSRGPIRMSALAAAALIGRETDIEVLAHYTCRGKNMFSMISDLLGAAAVGIRNVLLVSGDPPALGPYPDASAAFDIDSIGLTHVVQGLNRGIDPGGNSIGEPARFAQGVVLNQGAADRERELERFRFKIDAGADFAVTQPVFDVKALEPYLERAAAHELPVIAGIWPFPDLRSAEFLANEMPGVTVPQAIVERMRRAQASGPAAAREEGVAIALEAIGAARPLVAGFHVSAPRRKVDMALRVLREAGVAVGSPS